VKDRYQATLAAIPSAARSYVVYFAFDKTTLLPDAQATLAAILDDYRQRPAPEVIIIGHTDQSGAARYNEELSQRRADALRRLLIASGVAAEVIETAWRGDREPLPETTGKSADQRNRRVEVKLR
jgi:outer membrane protein OmpA-like peptidoglycan-associated protein